MPYTSEPGRSVGSRLLEVLFTFRPGRPRLTQADLTRATGLPHATVRRHVLELVRAGALDRAPDGTLTIGIRLWELGTLAPMSMPLRTVARPFMEDLYTALNQHVQLAVLEGDEAIIVERLSARSAVPVVSRVGGRLPLHASAIGKVLLAHAGTEAIDEVLDGELDRFTGRTVTDPKLLRRSLEDCQRTGVSVVREELSVEADSIATRIINREGRVVAALSVVVRAASVDLRRTKPTLIASGLGISRRLGWLPSVGVWWPDGSEPKWHS